MTKFISYYIEERVIKIADHMIKTGKTVREIGKIFGVSKSTVHKDITERLPEICIEKAINAKKVLADNKKLRYTRGGQATRKKHQEKN